MKRYKILGGSIGVLGHEFLADDNGMIEVHEDLVPQVESDLTLHGAVPVEDAAEDSNAAKSTKSADADEKVLADTRSPEERAADEKKEREARKARKAELMKEAAEVFNVDLDGRMSVAAMEAELIKLREAPKS